jgi:branched-chain amino acid transport system substrate-binding protein
MATSRLGASFAKVSRHDVARFRRSAPPSKGGLRRRTACAVALVLTISLSTACGTRLAKSAFSNLSTQGSNGSGNGQLASGDQSGGSTDSSGALGAGGSSGAGGLAGAAGGGAASGAAGLTGASGSGGGAGGASGGGGGGSGGGGAHGAVQGVHPVLGGGGACGPATGSPVTLGNVSTLSGVLGLLFSPVVPALQAFTKAVNSCGGLNGHLVRLIVGDDQDDPATAVTVANQQIQNSHILAFLGNIQVLTIDGMTSLINSSHIPIIGGDLTNDTWFSSPYIFPQGSAPESISADYLNIMFNTFHAKKVADVYCLEVPKACTQIDAALRQDAEKAGNPVTSSIQVSITAPSYTSQCLAMQQAGVEAVALTVDAPTQTRVARSCSSVGFHPHYVAYPLGVGNEQEFLNHPELANTPVPLQTFPWMANATPAQQYFQKAMSQYAGGAIRGYAGSLGWVAGALLVAATTNLPANPTTNDILNGLYSIKGNDLGGLTAPLTFQRGQNPVEPFCYFIANSNGSNNGWAAPSTSCLPVPANLVAAPPL